MSYTLEITFVGLCLFRQRGSRAMDVLMPDVTEHAHGEHRHSSIEPHVAQLSYDLVYEGQGQPSAGQPTCGVTHRCIDLGKRWVDLTHLQVQGGSNDPLGNTHFVNIHDAINGKQLPDEPKLVRKLAACVRLPRGSADLSNRSGPWWLVWDDSARAPIGPLDLVWKVVWSTYVPTPLTGVANTLDWHTKGLDGKNHKQLNRLIAQGTAQPVIKLQISNVPQSVSGPAEHEETEKPDPCTEASHFQALRELYDPDGTEWPHLVFNWQSGCVIQQPRMSITAYTCVPGKGQ